MARLEEVNESDRKRRRIDTEDSSELDSYSPAAKRPRLDPGDPGLDQPELPENCLRIASKYRTPDSPESVLRGIDSGSSEDGSPHEPGKKINVIRQENLYDMLNDSDAATDRDPAIQDLESVIKSFEDEIQVLPESQQPYAAAVTDTEFEMPVSVLGESPATHPDLGYLLEASDDELGLPPTTTTSGAEEDGATIAEGSDVVGVSSYAEELGELIGFDDEIPSYDSQVYGFNSSGVEDSKSNGEFVAVDGLFDNGCLIPEVDDSASGMSLWQPESLLAE